MKYILLAILLIILSANNFVVAKISTVSRFEFGKQWAFIREEVMLECRAGALFVINPGTLAQYPLNDVAMEQMRAGQVAARLLDPLVLDDIDYPSQKMSLEPFERRASMLCS